jgi:hypothetical protein
MTRLTGLFLAAALAVSPALAQQNPFGDLQPRKDGAKPQAVAYLFPEQVTVPAGKPTTVEFHFKVAEGLHINSHAPRSEDLIPTTLKLPETPGVHLAHADFPPGKDYAFSFSPTEKLSVYTGEFTVQAELVATRGDHLVEATLRYQACNSNTCMPPHSIPVAIDVIAR